MAIAFDTKVNSTEQTAVTSITLSMTVGSLTNGCLVVPSAVRNSAVQYAEISGVTYNGVALTRGKTQDGPAASRYLTAELWYLVNPASGAHNIVVTYAVAALIAVIGGISFSGVDQSSPLDASAGLSTTTGNPWTTAITTVADNAWIINTLYTSSDNAIAVNNSETSAWNVNVNGSPGDYIGAAYRGPITPAAATTTGWKNSPTGNDEGAMAVISLKPFVAAGTVKQLAAMGVG